MAARRRCRGRRVFMRPPRNSAQAPPALVRPEAPCEAHSSGVRLDPRLRHRRRRPSVHARLAARSLRMGSDPARRSAEAGADCRLRDTSGWRVRGGTCGDPFRSRRAGARHSLRRGCRHLLGAIPRCWLPLRRGQVPSWCQAILSGRDVVATKRRGRVPK